MFYCAMYIVRFLIIAPKCEFRSISAEAYLEGDAEDTAKNYQLSVSKAFLVVCCAARFCNGCFRYMVILLIIAQVFNSCLISGDQTPQKFQDIARDAGWENRSMRLLGCLWCGGLVNQCTIVVSLLIIGHGFDFRFTGSGSWSDIGKTKFPVL